MKRWQNYKFNEFVEINPTIPFDRKKEYSFIEMKDVDGINKFCQSHQKRQFSGAPRFYNNDTLFARITPCLENGKIAKVRNLDGGVGFGSTEFLVFHSRDNLSCNDFIYYLARWDEVRDFAEKNMEGTSGRQRVNKEAFSNLELKLPPLPEQRAIASVLSSFDDKIDLLHRQNATLEAMAEALFRQWFVVEAKEEWEEYTVDKIAQQLTDTINPLSFPDLLFNLYSIPAYDLNKNPELSYGKNILSNKFKIDDNCLLVSKLNPKFPRIWLLLENNLSNSIASTEFIPIIPFEKHSLPFLYCLFSSDRVIQELTNAASGTSGSHQRVRPEDILSITFMAPSLKYLSEFSTLILPFVKKISFNQRRIFTLEKLRDSLLPKLMSGEVRIKY